MQYPTLGRNNASQLKRINTARNQIFKNKMSPTQTWAAPPYARELSLAHLKECIVGHVNREPGAALPARAPDSDQQTVAAGHLE